MARTKRTTRENPDAARPQAQGEAAVFEQREFDPREEVIVPNMFACRQCDRKFPTLANRDKHERETHAHAYKFMCFNNRTPVSYQKLCARRSRCLREHFRTHHPEQDIEVVDEIEATVVANPVKQTVKRSATPDDSPAKKKREKLSSNAPETSEASTAASIQLVALD